MEDAGFTAKRAKKAVPLNAPSKEENLAKVQEIAEEIRKLKVKQEVEEMFLDESHFFTKPYIVRGWSKKGRPFSLRTPSKREGCTIFGAYEPATNGFFWKSSAQSDTRIFKQFLYQLEAHAAGRSLVLILDNASIHKTSVIRKFMENHLKIRLLHLVPYSPEYNPIEQV